MRFVIWNNMLLTEKQIAEQHFYAPIYINCIFLCVYTEYATYGTMSGSMFKQWFSLVGRFRDFFSS